MFKLIKKIPLKYQGICYYKNQYLLLKDNVISIFDSEFNKLKGIILPKNFNYITCNDNFIFLANNNEIYKYDFENLEKLNIEKLDIVNINYLLNSGLLIITKDKIYIYGNELNEYSNERCTNVLEINKKIYYIKKNKLCNQKKTIQQFDFEIKDCCYTNCFVILSECINIYEIDNCEKIAKLINCLAKKELTIPTSIAYIEQSLANILNEEANKIKRAICLSNDICDLLKINESVNQTLKQVILLEQVLCTKLDIYNNKK